LYRLLFDNSSLIYVSSIA